MTDDRAQLRSLAAQFTAPQDAQDAPESAQEAPEAPETATEAPEHAQDAPESAQEAPEAPETATEAPEHAQDAPESAQEAPEAPAGKTKTSLNLPGGLAQRLRAWRDDTGRSHGDAILSALIARLPALKERVAGDAERIELGLAPIAAGDSDEDRALVTFWATPAALARLDAEAASLAMTRTALIVELLDMDLPRTRS